MAKDGSGSEKTVETAMPKDAPPNGDAPTDYDLIDPRSVVRSGGYRRCRPRFTVGRRLILAAGSRTCSHPRAQAARTNPRQAPWRARCVETCTAGSASGLGKRTSSNAGTAPQADSTV